MNRKFSIFIGVILLFTSCQRIYNSSIHVGSNTIDLGKELSYKLHDRVPILPEVQYENLQILLRDRDADIDTVFYTSENCDCRFYALYIGQQNIVPTRNFESEEIDLEGRYVKYSFDTTSHKPTLPGTTRYQWSPVDVDDIGPQYKKTVETNFLILCDSVPAWMIFKHSIYGQKYLDREDYDGFAVLINLYPTISDWNSFEHNLNIFDPSLFRSLHVGPFNLTNDADPGQAEFDEITMLLEGQKNHPFLVKARRYRETTTESQKIIFEEISNPSIVLNTYKHRSRTKRELRIYNKNLIKRKYFHQPLSAYASNYLLERENLRLTNVFSNESGEFTFVDITNKINGFDSTLQRNHSWEMAFAIDSSKVHSYELGKFQTSERSYAQEDWFKGISMLFYKKFHGIANIVQADYTNYSRSTYNSRFSLGDWSNLSKFYNIDTTSEDQLIEIDRVHREKSDSRSYKLYPSGIYFERVYHFKSNRIDFFHNRKIKAL